MRNIRPGEQRREQGTQQPGDCFLQQLDALRSCERGLGELLGRRVPRSALGSRNARLQDEAYSALQTARTCAATSPESLS